MGTFTDDCLDDIINPNVGPGNSVQVGKPIRLDMTVRQRYDAEVLLEAKTDAPAGLLCDDTASTFWEAGNP